MNAMHAGKFSIMLTLLIPCVIGIIIMIWGKQYHKWWINYHDRNSNLPLVQMNPFRGVMKSKNSSKLFRFLGFALFSVSFSLFILVYMADSNPSPIALLRFTIRAHGGKDRIASYMVYRIRSKGTMLQGDNRVPILIDSLEKLPDKSRNVITIILDGQEHKELLVRNGNRLLYQTNGFTRIAQEMEVESARIGSYNTYVTRLVPLLRDSVFSLVTVGERKVNGQSAIGLKVSSISYPDIVLFFDKNNGLLIKSEQTITDKNNNKEFFVEQDFLDYRTLPDGVKFPNRKRTYFNSILVYDLELIDIRPLEKIDDSEFENP